MKMLMNINMFLVALTFFAVSKDTTEVANQLKEIFMTFGSPEILQCDKGSEFQGVLPLIYCLHLLREH